MAVLCGLLLTGSFPKFGSHWVAWVAMIPLLSAIRNQSGGPRFWTGFLAGFVHYLTLTYWLIDTMQIYGGLPWIVSVGILLLLGAYLALYSAVFSLVLPLLARTPIRLLFTAPALWVTLESIRSVAMTGFPWELLGYSQYQALRILQISDIFGVSGISFLIVAVNMGIFLLWSARSGKLWNGERLHLRSSAVAAGSACILLAAALLYGTVRMGAVRRLMDEAPWITASALQGNIPQDVKWDPEFKAATTDTYLKLTRQAMADGAELVVWPETATPFYFLRESALSLKIRAAIQKAGAWVILGSPAAEAVENEYRYFNSAYLISPEGRVTDRYDKQHLVPFGEYVPWQKLLFFVKKMVPGLIDFSTGQLGKVVSWQGGKIGVQICYEMIFPSLSRHAVKNGAGLLVHITNDAWFGRSSAPYQHLSIIAVRAVENRRSIIRSSNTGISSFIDPTGRILSRTPLFEEAALTEKVPVLSEKTFYTRRGDWFPVVCGLWVALAAINRIIQSQLAKRSAEKEKRHGTGT